MGNRQTKRDWMGNAPTKVCMECGLAQCHRRRTHSRQACKNCGATLAPIVEYPSSGLGGTKFCARCSSLAPIASPIGLRCQRCGCGQYVTSFRMSRRVLLRTLCLVERLHTRGGGVGLPTPARWRVLRFLRPFAVVLVETPPPPRARGTPRPVLNAAGVLETVKLLMVGDSRCGKTLLLRRYARGYLEEHFVTTIGVDFQTKTIDWRDGRRIRLQVWDTAGQERFRTITTSYFRGTHGAVIVYDVSDAAAPANVRNWVAQIRECADEGVQILLLGHVDRDEDGPRAITEAEGRAMAEACGCGLFFEVSARHGTNVNRAFDSLARSIADFEGRSQAPVLRTVDIGRWRDPPRLGPTR